MKTKSQPFQAPDATLVAEGSSWRGRLPFDMANVININGILSFIGGRCSSLWCSHGRKWLMVDWGKIILLISCIFEGTSLKLV